MSRKAWCTRKIVALLIKPIVFAAFPFPSPSSDLKVPIYFPAIPHARRCHNIFYVSRKLTRGASDRLLSIQSVSIGSDGVRLPTFSTLFTSTLQSQSLANWHAANPMEFCHGNQTPSDPMESVCRHFPAPPQELYFAVYLLRLSQTDMRPVRWTLASATRPPQIRWSPFADIFQPLLKNSTLLCIY